jgi:hypothetical protein
MPVLVHAPELVHDAARLLKDLQEEELPRGSRLNFRNDARRARHSCPQRVGASCRAARGAASSGGSSRGW